MFSGSGIAGCMIIKDLAYPVVRPVSNGGWSTYWAVVLAPKGSPRFTQDAAYFDNINGVKSAVDSCLKA